MLDQASHSIRLQLEEKYGIEKTPSCYHEISGKAVLQEDGTSLESETIIAIAVDQSEPKPSAMGSSSESGSNSMAAGPEVAAVAAEAPSDSTRTRSPIIMMDVDAAPEVDAVEEVGAAAASEAAGHATASHGHAGHGAAAAATPMDMDLAGAAVLPTAHVEAATTATSPENPKEKLRLDAHGCQIKNMELALADLAKQYFLDCEKTGTLTFDEP